MNLKAPKGIDVESWFIECYRKHQGHPMQILLGLYKGNYHKFFLAVVFFVIKHAPVWVLPIVTANIINDITKRFTRNISEYTDSGCYNGGTCSNECANELYVYKI